MSLVLITKLYSKRNYACLKLLIRNRKNVLYIPLHFNSLGASYFLFLFLLIILVKTVRQCSALMSVLVSVFLLSNLTVFFSLQSPIFVSSYIRIAILYVLIFQITALKQRDISGLVTFVSGTSTSLIEKWSTRIPVNIVTFLDFTGYEHFYQN